MIGDQSCCWIVYIVVHCEYYRGQRKVLLLPKTSWIDSESGADLERRPEFLR